MHSNRLRMVMAGLCALVLSLVPSTSVFAQGVTTSSISGFITGTNGNPVSGARITVVHVPTGTRFTTVSRGLGQYDVAGLRPGGPYTVRAEFSDGSSAEATDVYAETASSASVSLKLVSDVVKLEAVNVQASRDTTFDSSSMGTQVTFTSRDVEQLASVRQDVQDLMNLDPRAQLQQSANGDSNYMVSVQGQNPRENLFLIDGVSATDNFGLNSNGYAGLKNPLPLPWIESAAFQINQYDIIYSGFAGGLFDATLKSGTNQFHGSFYELYTGTNFRGPDPVVGALGTHEKVQSRTTGATLGGPILKDRLFFFVGYEAFREIAAPQPQTFLPANDAVLSSVLAQASALGENNGSFFSPFHQWEQNFVAKLDWNISDAHKFEVTFRHTDGQSPITYNYTSSFETSLSGSWYDSHRVDQSITAKLNSDWSSILPGLKTELETTWKKYSGTAKLEGPDIPSVTVFGINGVSTLNAFPPFELYFGPSPFYQLNQLYTTELEEHLIGQYSVGSHSFKFGSQFDRVQLTNAFVPNYLGSYTFSNVADYLAATPTAVTLATPAPGFTLQQAIAHYAQLNITPFLEDVWTPNERLTLLAGVRLDYPLEPQNPPFNPIFYKATGISNKATINGNYTVSPRFGFNYNLPTERKTQVRGGAGLFVGVAPFVWLENSFSTAGQLATYTIPNSSNTIKNADGSPFIFTGNPATQALPPVAAGNPVPAIDYLPTNLHEPSNWKENIAIDHELPFWSMTLTLEADFSQVKNDLTYINTNLRLAATGPQYLPDGRLRYNGNITPTNIGPANFVPGFTTGNFYVGTSSQSSPTLEANPTIGQALELVNTNQGASQEYTINLHRPFKNNWAWTLAYSHTHATQVATLGGTTAGGGYGSLTYVNPNDEVPYHSAYASPDKVVASLSRRFHFLKLPYSATTVSAQFIAETGLPFSYTFKGDPDGSGDAGASLFYVPTGPSDPKVRWLSTSERDDFFNNFLPAHPDLAQWSGRITARNVFYTSWQKTLNLHVEQQVPLYQQAHLTLFADCYNFANLLNKKWGVVTNFGSYNDLGGRQTVAGTGYDPLGNGGAGQYIYVFNKGTQTTPTTYSDESRWMIQVGARLDF